MKVYNRLVLRIDTYEVIEEDSFEYEGEVAYCKGPDTGASRDAFKLQQQQLIKQQKKLKELQIQEQGMEAAKQVKLDELLKRKKTGYAATILTDSTTTGGGETVSKKSLFA